MTAWWSLDLKVVFHSHHRTDGSRGLCYGEGVTLPEGVHFGLFNADKHVGRGVTIGEKCDVTGSKVNGGVKRGITGMT